jgi:hypothetical protein
MKDNPLWLALSDTKLLGVKQQIKKKSEWKLLHSKIHENYGND